MIVSPAMMKIFEECQQKYIYIYIDKINLPQNKYVYQKGKHIHAIANYFLKGQAVSKLESVLSKEEKSLWDYLKNTCYFKYEVLNTEYQLSIKLTDYWIGGRLDALVKSNDDYYILDYKTGSIPQNPDFDYQTMVYLLCANQLIKKYNSLSFVYIDLKNKTEKIIKFSNDLKYEYENKINKILFNMDLVTKSHSVLLKNNKCICDYYCICPKKMIQ